MNPEELKSCVGQTLLLLKGHYTGQIDGIWGPLSITAADRWASEERKAIAARVLPDDRQKILDGRATIGFLRTIAGQIYLSDLGPYSGAIDGNWGPQTRSAAAAWAAVQYPPEPVDGAAGALTPYGVAQRYLGVREIPGKKHNGTILNWYRRLQISIFDDETPWCGVFVAHCVQDVGLPYPKMYMRAKAWADYGSLLRRDRLAPGAILVFDRAGGGHVGFVVGKTTGGALLVLGGNQGNEVNIRAFPLDRVSGYRWPASAPAPDGELQIGAALATGGEA